MLGSRFLDVHPYNMPLWRRWANRFLTELANKKFDQQHSDLHTGARIYSRNFLQRVPFETFSDDFVFDQQMLMWGIANQVIFREFPMPAKYDSSVSSISISRGIRYGLGCLAIILTTTRPNDRVVP